MKVSDVAGNEKMRTKPPIPKLRSPSKLGFEENRTQATDKKIIGGTKLNSAAGDNNS